MCLHRVIKNVPIKCLCNPFPEISSPNGNKASILDMSHTLHSIMFCYRNSPAFFSHLPIASIINHSWLQDTVLLIWWGQVRHTFSKKRENINIIKKKKLFFFPRWKFYTYVKTKYSNFTEFPYSEVEFLNQIIKV